MEIHDLKAWPDPFAAIVAGRKLFEFRREDRDPRFAVGDHLHIYEWESTDMRSPTTGESLGWYTGRMVTARVTYLARGPDWGIPEGYVVMSLADVTVYSRYVTIYSQSEGS